MNNVTEQELNEVSTAPRVTEEFIESSIQSIEYIVRGTLTICIITLDNGFTSVGTSACVNEANFDAEIGKRISRKNAFEPLWGHFGFVLAETGNLRESFSG